MQFLYRLREFPVLIILILLCMGITAGYYAPILSTHILLIVTGIILFSLLCLKFCFLSGSASVIILVLIFMSGFGIVQHKLIVPEFNISSKHYINAEVVTYPVKKDRYTKFIVETENKGKLPSRLLVYIFSKDSLSIDKGDNIEFSGKIKATEKRENQEFDFSHYMKRQYVQHSCFVSKDNYKLTDSGGFSFSRWCSGIRSAIGNSLQRSGVKEPELGLLNAMLLGNKGNLDPELKQNYIAAGVIHILAISGLHTGIVFLLISFLLQKIFRINKTGIWFLILSSTLLWFYTIITGMSPSVLRATIILCFILIGKYSGRQTIIYNAIAGSAILILVFDPATLFSPGFQLSYAAYTSIMYLYPKLYSLLVFNNRISDSIWKIVSVSVAAQLGTLPIAILYFHHIYYYSVLTNICISVFIPIIIYGGIGMVLVAQFVDGTTIFTSIITEVIRAVDKIIDIIAHLPGAVSGYFNICLYETILIYSIVFCSFVMIWYRKRKMIFIILISFFLLFSYQSYMDIFKHKGMEQIAQSP